MHRAKNNGGSIEVRDDELFGSNKRLLKSNASAEGRLKLENGARSWL